MLLFYIKKIKFENIWFSNKTNINLFVDRREYMHYAYSDCSLLCRNFGLLGDLEHLCFAYVTVCQYTINWTRMMAIQGWETIDRDLTSRLACGTGCNSKLHPPGGPWRHEAGLASFQREWASLSTLTHTKRACRLSVGKKEVPKRDASRLGRGSCTHS
jgi:hypothetical protein